MLTLSSCQFPTSQSPSSLASIVIRSNKISNRFPRIWLNGLCMGKHCLYLSKKWMLLWKTGTRDVWSVAGIITQSAKWRAIRQTLREYRKQTNNPYAGTWLSFGGFIKNQMEKRGAYATKICDFAQKTLALNHSAQGPHGHNQDTFFFTQTLYWKRARLGLAFQVWRYCLPRPSSVC